MKVNMRGGGGTLDRVVVNKPSSIWMRIYTFNGNMYSFAIMADNNVLQTKYMAGMYTYIGSLSIGNSLHITIENVSKHMGTTRNDAEMMIENTTIYINDNCDSSLYGTWTSTIVPENVTVELDCKVVDNSTNTIVTECGPDRWSDSVFNRIPIDIWNKARFGCDCNGYAMLVPPGT